LKTGDFAKVILLAEPLQIIARIVRKLYLVQEHAPPDNQTEKTVHVVKLRVLHLVIQQSVFLVNCRAPSTPSVYDDQGLGRRFQW
jgi:hypothetical protein